MPASAQYENIVNPGPDQNPLIKFEKIFDGASFYQVVQAGWIKGPGSNVIRRVYEITCCSAKLATTSDVGNRKLTLSVIKATELRPTTHSVISFVTDNTPADSFADVILTPTGYWNSAEVSPNTSVQAGPVALTRPLYLSGGDYILAQVADGFAGDIVRLYIEALFLNYRWGIKEPG